VAYFDATAIEGKKDFTITYQNVNYKFSSKENLKSLQKTLRITFLNMVAIVRMLLEKKERKLA
jgi:hypothetical protein